MKPTYIFRVDDICPTMNWKNFDRLEEIFDKYNIKPIVGIIPDNKDTKLHVNNPNIEYWKRMKLLVTKGWVIAQHGYQHQYINKEPGMLGITNHSEFSKIKYSEQYKKISSGKKILEKKLGIKIKWWMAPSHSFDETTCKVLVDLKFKYITDGIALYPYIRNGLIWVPQQLWKPAKKLFGVWTICIHPNSENDMTLSTIERFIVNNMIGNSDIDLLIRYSIFNYLYYIYWKIIHIMSRIYELHR
ncbi:MAG: DUF2334 domain-containing protein [Microgenomates group bacterium]